MRKPRLLPHRYKVYDVVHKSAVTVLIAFSVLLTGKLVYDITYYIKYQRPARMRKFKLQLEEQLAAKHLQEEEEQLKQEQLREKAQDLPFESRV